MYSVFSELIVTNKVVTLMNVNISWFIYILAVAIIIAYNLRDVLITNYTHMSFEHHIMSKCRMPTYLQITNVLIINTIIGSGSGSGGDIVVIIFTCICCYHLFR